VRAVWLEKHVEPKDIRVVEIDRPHVHAGQVLVHVHAAGVNPSDVRYAAGQVASTPLPRVPGRDFAGEIVEGPDELIGVEVYGSGGDLGIRRDGSHAEFLALSSKAYALKPHALTMVQAAAVGVPYITAYKAVVELTRLNRGETILILGGSGAVGSAAAQIAKWIGAKVIVTTRRSDPGTTWRDYADTVITVPDDDIAEVTLSATEGEGAQVVLNAVGAPVFDSGVKSMAHGGRMVCITAAGEHQVCFDLMYFYKHELRWYGLDTLELSAADCAPVLDQLRSGFDSGAFKIEIGTVIPLERASEAYQLVATGRVGKVVLDMTPGP
jgi:NADPH:quinone reductase-like Zn-dependent oxidoreductase